MSTGEYLTGRVAIELRPDGMVAIQILGPISSEYPTSEERQALLDAAAVALYYERLNLMKISQRVENIARVKSFVSNLERIRSSNEEGAS